MKASFDDHRRRQDEGVEVRQAHAAIERIDRKGQRQPGVDDAVHVGIVRIEVDASADRSAPWPPSAAPAGRTRTRSPACRPCGSSAPRSRRNPPTDASWHRTVTKRSGQSARRAVGVMPLQRPRRSPALVAERSRGTPRCAADCGHQAVPVVMRDLVAEMPEQGAIGLAHLAALALALGIVGLRQIDGDEAVVVPGQDRRCAAAARWIGEEIERQRRPDPRPGGQRQPKAQQRVEQPVLGELDLAPVRQVFRQREIGDGAVVAAGGAETVRLVSGHQPVADVVTARWRNSDSAPRRSASACQRAVVFFQSA